VIGSFNHIEHLDFEKIKDLHTHYKVQGLYRKFLGLDKEERWYYKMSEGPDFRILHGYLYVGEEECHIRLLHKGNSIVGIRAARNLDQVKKIIDSDEMKKELIRRRFF
jgi:hypothetical protein